MRTDHEHASRLICHTYQSQSGRMLNGTRRAAPHWLLFLLLLVGLSALGIGITASSTPLAADARVVSASTGLSCHAASVECHELSSCTDPCSASGFDLPRSGGFSALSRSRCALIPLVEELLSCGMDEAPVVPPPRVQLLA